ncbi:gem-associated protein 8-like [Elysia marginata]|uniref:Gem-associated protein 8-like n=1 Tax=Elysia marginata TaxID=1093978 RepID=A0AAV4HB72_9GAST|nr:gem-associated protein 8-like [Elysia marginata]
MAERGHTSSMTSVTEYDSSIDSETDTTESTNSNITSSLLSSTDTDDKLTPSLGGISISAKSNMKSETHAGKDKNKTGIKRSQPSDVNGDASLKESVCNQDYKNSEALHPSKRAAHNRKHRPHDRIPSSCRRPFFGRESNTYSFENLGVDGSEMLSTDLSDTSSRPAENSYLSMSQEDKTSSKQDNGSSAEPTKTTTDHSSHLETPSWEPNMNSSRWYDAGCFSRYWNHYGFVMAWYRAHMDAVHSLHRDFQRRHGGAWSNTGGQTTWHLDGQRRNSNARRKRQSRKARKRRLAKAQRKAAKSSNCQEGVCQPANDAGDQTGGDIVQEEEGEEVEMEITEDMMEFFATSLKHRMERDMAKSNSTDAKEKESMVNIEDAPAGQTGPSTAPPQEPPGARRAQEMKQLYGAGAPMIHGMETALQMAFDRTQDKFQPKLWPNMPLKIVFG